MRLLCSHNGTTDLGMYEDLLHLRFLDSHIRLACPILLPLLFVTGTL